MNSPLPIPCFSSLPSFLVVVGIFSINALPVNGQSLILLDSNKTHLGNLIEVLYSDENEKIPSINDLLERQNTFDFQPSDAYVAAFYPQERARWLRIRLVNTFDLPHFLTINSTTIDSLDIYIGQGDSLVRSYQTGRYRSFNKSLNGAGKYIIPIEKGDLTYYFRFKSNLPVHFDLQHTSQEVLQEEQKRLNLLHGVYFGIFMLASIYSLLAYLVLGDRTLFHYFLFIVSMGIIVGLTTGISFEYLWPQIPFINHFYVSIIALVSTSNLLMTTSFIETKKHLPRYHIGFNILYALHFLAVLLDLVGYSITGIYLLQSVGGLTILFVTFVLILLISHRDQHAKFFLIAHVGYLAGVALILMSYAHIIPYSFWGIHALPLGILLQILLLSLVVSNRIRQYRFQLEASSKQSERLFHEKNELVTKQNEKLAQMVKENTAELTERAKEIQYKNEELTAQQEELLMNNRELVRLNNKLSAGEKVLLKTFNKFKDNEKALQEQNEVIYQKNKEIHAQNEEMNAQNEHLRKTIENLKEAQSKLVQSEKMVALGLLTAGIAHEINNPINYINSGITGLKNALDKIVQLIKLYKVLSPENFEQAYQQIKYFEEKVKLDILLPQVIRVAENIHKGAERTSEIVKSLRVFSRTEERKKIFTDLQQGIEATLLLLQNQTKHRIEIIRNYTKLPEVVCEPGKINQVFMNLLVNAIQAIPEKGRITVTTQYDIDNETVQIKIQDTGQGISKQIMQQVFQPFFTTKKVGEGTGLGLSISKSIIDDHGGHIEVESMEKVGTTFTIVLPIGHGSASIVDSPNQR